MSYASENDLQKTLRGFESPNLLNQYLWAHGFLDETFHQASKSDSVQFQLNSLEIDFFKKNLFGTPKDELIVQLRDGKSWTVVVFYEQNGRLWKVPHCLGPQPTANYSLGGTLLNCANAFDMFIFDFVQIRSQEQFNIITKTSEECGKGTYSKRAIWNITKDTIESALTWLENGLSYYDAHEFRVYTTKTDIQITHQADYPQEVILTTTTRHEQLWDIQYNDQHEIIDSTGHVSTETTVTTYRFKASEKLEISSTSEKVVRNQRAIGRKEE